ncbi:MAG: hypothetical protein RQ826_02110 [Xanthomonadales bacterium]|nr:hypothetical protein [Xanthomonadales bacterium]
MGIPRTPILIAAFLLTALLGGSGAAWAGGPHHGGHRGYDDHYRFSLGLNRGYPPPYAARYGPRHGHDRGYYRGYGAPYSPAWGGRIGFGYRSGYHDSYSLFFSLPLYLEPRYRPAPAALQPAAAAPVVKTVPRAPAAECLQTREYQTTIEIGGRTVPAYGTACLQADGDWKVISGPFAAE